MKIVIITGQTATGKTKLAQKLADELNGEIVNYDSRQIYKYLDIITGKDIAHDKIHLYDLVDPNKYFSSFDYVKYALPVIKKILSLGKVPILVGGTYLYLKHLLYNVETENIKPDWNLRKDLGKKTVEQLREILAKNSLSLLKSLNQSDRNNPQRLIRKIEIIKSGFLQSHLQPPRLNLLSGQSKLSIAGKLNIKKIKLQFIGLKFKTKAKLIVTIKKRVEERLKMGAINEVKSLLEKGFKQDDPGLKTIGYVQIIDYLKGRLTKQQTIEQWINKEIQYAKRQYTFMKKDPNIVWREI